MICVNDVIDELREENIRLSNELLFANKCLVILLRFRDTFCGQQNVMVFSDNIDITDQFKEIKDELNILLSNKIDAESNQLYVVCKDSDIKNDETNSNQKTSEENGIKSVDNKRERSYMKFDFYERNELKTYGNLKVGNSFKNERKWKNKRKIRCDWIGCDYYTDNTTQLRSHKNIHLDLRPFQCTYSDCDKAFHSRRSMRKHVRSVHEVSEKITEKTYYKCDWNGCNYSTLVKSLLTYHRNKHLGIKPFMCSFSDCKKTFHNKFTLKIHVKVNHQLKNEFPFKCPHMECEKSFKLESSLKSHLRTHSDAISFKCSWPQCEVAYRCAKSLERHLKKQHLNLEPSIYPCDWPGCDYKADRMDLFRRHRVTHTGERNFPCSWPLCGKKFKNENHLREHMRIHTNDKRYKCQWPGCEYCCVNIGNLKKHFMIHCKKMEK